MGRKDFNHQWPCPRCGGMLPVGYPGALSRRDHKTEICSDCGKEEGMKDLMKTKETK